MTWSTCNNLDTIIAQSRKKAWLGRDNFVSGFNNSVVTALINETGMSLFDLSLISNGKIASLGYARQGLMARYTMRTASPELFWFRCSLLKRCSLIKREVPVSWLGNRSWRVYVQICFVSYREMLYNNNKERNGSIGKMKDILTIEVYALFLRPLQLSTQWWKLNAWGCLCPSAAPKQFNPGTQLPGKVMASYQNVCLKTASCKQFPPTPVSLPVHFAGCLFQRSVFLLLSCCSGSATKISASHLSVWEALFFFNNSIYLFFY